MTWTKEKTDLLRDLRASGQSFGQIAKRVGKSRSACIAKADRMGLPKDKQGPAGRQRSLRSRAADGAEQKRRLWAWGTLSPATSKRPDVPGAVPELVDELVIPPHERMTLLVRDDLGRLHANDRFTSSRCRWPIGDPLNPEFHFCGRHGVPGLPYCEFHAGKAWPNAQARERPDLDGEIEQREKETETV